LAVRALVTHAVTHATSSVSAHSLPARPEQTRCFGGDVRKPAERFAPDLQTKHGFWSRAYAVFLVLFQVYLWSGFLVQTKRSPAPTSDVVLYSLAIAGGIATVAWSVMTKRRIWIMGFWVAYTFSQLIVNFSYLYWSHGSASDFTMPLNHLDAIYVAVGTLSTSGTGNIAAVSETTRGFQTIQNILDIGLVLFAVSLFVARFADAFARESA
jgi:hypothetical protein